MKRSGLSSLSVDKLVECFIEITLAQDEALLMDDYSRFNHLFVQMEAVKAELKGRSGDGRRALLRLFDHPNAQVRLKAAKATLAIDPQGARSVLEMIAKSQDYPQAGEAGMSLWNLDGGIFKPV